MEIEDPDELASAERDGWLTPAEADLARRTAAEMAGVLRNGQAGWLALGWHRLATLV